MDLDAIRRERSKAFGWKNIAPLAESLDSLPKVTPVSVEYEDTIKIILPTEYKESYASKIKDIAISLKPWRKGPFEIGELFIDSEWQSFIKYNLLLPHINIKDKIVADVGCNNGYYMFRMLKKNPKQIVGFDPSALYMLQFKFIDKFINSGIEYELLGVEHLEFYEHKFDTIFCLGVLYHRSDPVSTLKSLKRALNRNGELFLDTFMIDGDEHIALSPANRYSKIPNIYFIPTVPTLINWCKRAGFGSIEVIDIKKTEHNEQRKTEWIDTQSLQDFLDPNDSTKTIEGYPAPKRVYIKAIL